MTNFQAAAGAQGRAFEDAVARMLQMGGWRILLQHWREPVTLIEVDLVVIDPNEQTWWVECKGSWQSASDRNGSKRTDTAKKAIANAALLSTVPNAKPRLLATSDLPKPGSSGHRWLELAIAQRWINRVEVLSTFSVVRRQVVADSPDCQLSWNDELGGGDAA